MMGFSNNKSISFTAYIFKLIMVMAVLSIIMCSCQISDDESADETPDTNNFIYCFEDKNEISIGNYIFYIDSSDNKLYREDEHGTKTLVYDDIVYYAKNVNGALYFTLWYKDNNTGVFLLTDLEDLSGIKKVSDEACFYWQSDGRYIYYLKVIDTPDIYDNMGLFRMNLDGSKIKQLTNKDGIQAFYQKGSYCYFSVDSGVYKVDINGKNEKLIMEDVYAYAIYADRGWVYIDSQSYCYAVREDGSEVITYPRGKIYSELTKDLPKTEYK